MKESNKPKQYPSYRQRNELLIKMGYATYQEYLASPLWASIKQTVFEMKGNRCYICTKETNVLHHKGYGYETLIGKNLDPIVPLCRECHHQIEFKPNGEKRVLRKVEVAFNALVKQKNKRFKKWKGDKGRYVPGRCITCGKSARRNTQYCRPCGSAAGITVVKLCVVCGDAPKLEDNRWCITCLAKFMKLGEGKMKAKRFDTRSAKYLRKVIRRIDESEHDKRELERLEQEPTKWYRVSYDHEKEDTTFPFEPI